MSLRQRLLSLAFPLRALVGRGKLERDMDEELRAHLEMQEAHNRRHGLDESAARRAARVGFGSVDSVKEECRQSVGVHFFDTLAQDVRFGVRSLLRTRGFTVAVVLTLGLGIGANTAVFSVVRGILLRPLPYAHGERMVAVRQDDANAGVRNLGFSVAELQDLSAAARTFDGVAEYHTMNFTLLGGDEPLRVRTAVVSAGWFDLLGVAPLLGRTFRPEDDAHGADPVLVLTYEYWSRTFGQDAGVVGRTFEMNDRPHRVVGVLPPIPQYPDENDVFMPASACPFRARGVASGNRRARLVSMFARLRPDAGPEPARLELDNLLAGFKREHPDSYSPAARPTAIVERLSDLMVRSARPTFVVLFATVALVLLIACANVANLTLARLSERRRELAVRAALGAGRRRLLRQLVTESLLLGLAGGALGLVFAAAVQGMLTTFAARFTARATEVQLDGTVLLFALVVSVVTGLFFGTLPGLPSAEALARTSGSEGRAAGGRGGQRTRTVLVVSQLALSFTLLIGAALMLRSFAKLQAVDPGFQVENVLTMGLHLNWSTHTTPQGLDRDRVLAFHDLLQERIRALPGVLNSGTAFAVPLNAGFQHDFDVFLEGQDPGAASAVAVAFGASAGYFEALAVPVRAGRVFTDADRGQASDAAIVNDRFVRRYVPAGDPVGRRLSFDRGRTWRTVVGVVGDVRQADIDRDPEPIVYLPFRQFPGFSSTLFVRTQAEPMALAERIRGMVAELSRDTAVGPVQTLEQIRGDALAPPRLTTALLGAFAALALVIAVTGLAGVLAYAVSQRTREIGVRVALGAAPANILSMVLRQGLTSIALGLAIGLTGALALSRLVSKLLYGVAATDPLCFAGSVVVLAVAGVVACLVPARQAVGIEPMRALRTE
jgi:putative ABC transport system permease protein